MNWIVYYLYFLSIFEVFAILRVLFCVRARGSSAVGEDFLSFRDTHSDRANLSEVRLFLIWLIHIIAIRGLTAFDGYSAGNLRHLNAFVHIVEALWFSVEYFLSQSKKKPDTIYWVIIANALVFTLTDICL